MSQLGLDKAAELTEYSQLSIMHFLANITPFQATMFAVLAYVLIASFVINKTRAGGSILPGFFWPLYLIYLAVKKPIAWILFTKRWWGRPYVGAAYVSKDGKFHRVDRIGEGGQVFYTQEKPYAAFITVLDNFRKEHHHGSFYPGKDFMEDDPPHNLIQRKNVADDEPVLVDGHGLIKSESFTPMGRQAVLSLQEEAEAIMDEYHNAFPKLKTHFSKKKDEQRILDLCEEGSIRAVCVWSTGKTKLYYFEELVFETDTPPSKTHSLIKDANQTGSIPTAGILPHNMTYKLFKQAVTTGKMQRDYAREEIELVKRRVDKLEKRHKES